MSLGLLKSLYPRIYVDTVLDIPVEQLQDLGIKALIFDLDNTITEWNSNSIKADVTDWFAQITEAGFKACILSNNNETRGLKIASKLGIEYIHRARKPSRKGYRRAMQIIGAGPDETAVIGDQIFTDILGGNRAGLYTILVKPIARAEFAGTKISRFFEYFILRGIGSPKKRIGVDTIAH